MPEERFFPCLSRWLPRPKALRFWVGIFAAVAASLSLSPAASAQDSYVACIGNAGGTNTNPKAGCPPGSAQSTGITGVSIGGFNPAEVASGVLKQGTTPYFTALSFSKVRDAVSDSLAQDAYQGTVVGAIIVGIYPSGSTTPSYTLALRGVVFESFQIGAGGGSPPQESLSAGYVEAFFVNNLTNQTVQWAGN